MKTYMPLDGFRWSCDSDSALCDMRQTNVLGRAGGGVLAKCEKTKKSRLLTWNRDFGVTSGIRTHDIQNHNLTL